MTQATFDSTIKGISATDLLVGWDQRAIAQVPELKLTPGAIVAIAGPNGAGKSTLIKTLARQITPLSGTITLDGQEISAYSARDFAQRVAYVPQMVDLFQDLSVKELVQLGRNPHQKWWSWQAAQTDETWVTEAMKATGTWELRHKFVSSLSGGERQRTSIAMALAQSASYVLLDEPTAHLDFKHQLELVDLMKAMRAQDIGLLVILHDLNLMARVADNILFLKKDATTVSVPAAFGRAKDVLTPDVLQAVYDVEVQVFTDAESGQQNFVPSKVVV